MTPATLENLRAWFTSYAKRFADAGGNLHPMQRLKLAHSLRVARNARLIAEGLTWEAPAVALAEITGLLHDTGRFPQFAEFGTFSDDISVNHAEKSCAVLEEERVLACLPGRERAIVLDAIRLHNRKALPVELAADIRPFAELLRDADKLDIFFVFDDAIRNDRLGDYPEISLRVDLAGPPNPVLLDAHRTRVPAPYSTIRSLADFLLLQLLWMYDINHVSTLRLVLERNVIASLAEHLPATPEVTAAVQAAERFVQNRVAAGR